MKNIKELSQLFNAVIIDGIENFVLSAENTKIGEGYLKQLKENAQQYALFDIFRWDAKNNSISINKHDFIKWQKEVLSSYYKGKKRFSTSQRIFFKGNQNYFSIPVDNETIELLKKKIKSAARLREVDLKINLNTTYGIVEISEHDYQLFQTKSFLKVKFGSIAKRLYGWDEGKKCHYTSPLEGETLDQLNNKLRNALNRNKALAIDIRFHKNVELNRVECNEQVFACIQALQKKVKKPKLFQGILTREFVYDQTRDVWTLKAKQDEDLLNVLNTLRTACGRRNIGHNVFYLHDDKIEVSNENFTIFKIQYLKKKANRSKAYGLTFRKDEQNNVYYAQTSEDRYIINRSLKALAKLLGIKVSFRMNQGRVEISVDDYEKWIAHPIINESLTKRSTVPVQKAKKLKAKKTEKPQKAENTKGGISVKYLDGAFAIPMDISAEKADKDNENMLSKGHVIPFEELQNAFEKENNKRFKTDISIDFDGIKAIVSIYKSQQENLKEVFLNNNIVFVRAGRMEKALIPSLMQDENTIIVILMTGEELEEMEKSLGFSPLFKLPSHIKVGIIESCALKNQPLGQEGGYLRASNIKRTIAFALAEGFGLKSFVLMDDNTTQIQMAQEVANDNSVESLFTLFHQYKAKGTICATLGSFEFFKPITHPLEAKQIEDIEERLGSKIMFVDYKRLSKKLKTENKALHELISPCSLWWGEDYYNMLAILQLTENEAQAGLLGVVPFSVAWHTRSHAHQNKAKTMPHFKLANIWLDADEAYIKSLTPHQENNFRLMQSLVRKAIEQQESKQQKFFENLSKEQIEEAIHEVLPPKENPLEENSLFRRGYNYGVQIAKCGHPLDMHKLQSVLNARKMLEGASKEEYIKGIVQGHDSVWQTLSPQTRAICRGYRDGLLAAKEGYKANKLNMNAIPSVYLEQKEFYLQGYQNGNTEKWNSLKDSANKTEVESIASKMGLKRAESGFDINDDKLTETMASYGANAAAFENAYKNAFSQARNALSESDIVIRKAQKLAKDLNSSTQEQLDENKLKKEALKKYGQGPLAILYKDTVLTEFNKLRARRANHSMQEKDDNIIKAPLHKV